MSPLMKFQKIFKAESEIKINKNVEENMEYLNDDYIRNAIIEYIKLYNVKKDVDLDNHYLMVGFVIREIYKQISSDLLSDG